MTPCLTEIFNKDFKDCRNKAQFHKRFFGKTLALGDLRQIFETVHAAQVTLAGKAIPSALLIPGTDTGKPPFVILAQLHGNEPAGLAGIALAMALGQAGLLTRPVIGAIGNPLAAAQYFAAWAKDPAARQETRDAYRCGLDENGALLPDMNRIPVDFLTRDPTTHHNRRAQELYWLGERCSGIADIHTARGNMVCVTDHKRDAELRGSPIRAVLTGLAEAISAHTSTGTATVQTLKTILHPLPNIESQTGIEAGRHEAADAPRIAAAFACALLHTLGISALPPLKGKDNGRFTRYAVKPRLTYADLALEGRLGANDAIYMAKACTSADALPDRAERVIVRKKDGSHALQSILAFIVNPQGELAYAVYQYEEMEAIAVNETVAVAVPSGAVFKNRAAFSGIFLSKSVSLYDKDPSVGPWPVAADRLAAVKFCYPCDVSEITLDFKTS